MARRSNKKVDEVRHTKASLVIDIFLTPGNKFEAEVFGQTVQHDTAEGCKNLVYKTIEENLNIDFKPVIEIHHLRPWDTSASEAAFLGLEARRYYYGPNPKGHIYTVAWTWAEREPEKLMDYARGGGYGFSIHDLKGRPFVPPMVLGSYSLLPYTEETWLAVTHLIKLIEQAKQRLDEITKADDAGLEKFALVGQALSNLLLPSGDK